MFVLAKENEYERVKDMRNVKEISNNNRITIPKEISDQFKTRFFRITKEGNKITLTPVILYSKTIKNSD